MSDRDFWKFFSGMVATLVAVTVTLVAIASAVGAKPKGPEAAMEAKAIAERIKPVGQVTVAGSAVMMNAMIPSAHADGPDKGKAVYDATCSVCHGMGIAGAPKFGDKAAWAARIAQGNNTLYDHAIKGYQGKAGLMPPKGGNMALKDDEVKAAVDYMVSKAK